MLFAGVHLMVRTLYSPITVIIDVEGRVILVSKRCLQLVTTTATSCSSKCIFFFWNGWQVIW